MAGLTGDYEQISTSVRRDGPEAVCEFLAGRLKDRKQFHELFDARLMQYRNRLGLPLVADSELEDVPEPIRDQLEQGYLEACREVGQLLLAEGQIRGAWMYLRPAGERELMKAGLRAIPTDDDNIEAWIETAVYEGVDLEQGFQKMLERYGTCNAITTFESTMHGRRLDEQRQVAGVLIRWLHHELRDNLLASLEGQTEAPPRTIAEILKGREGMFGEYTTHIDVSHLTSVVRFARLVVDPELLALARDLTEYGRALHENFQQAGEPPFEALFRSHGLFFAAQLDQQVDESVDYFRAQAESADLHAQTTLAVEVYIELLARLGRYDDAIEARARLIPPGVATSGFAPSLLQLSQAAGNFETLLDLCRQRDDLLGFAVGQLADRADDRGAADGGSPT